MFCTRRRSTRSRSRAGYTLVEVVLVVVLVAVVGAAGFMLGFSFEDDGYIARLARWLEQLDAVAQELRPKGEPPLTFAFSFFVPKPQTPFALEPMPARAELQHRRKLLKASFRGRSRLKFESPAWSLLQERLSRGARDAAGTIAFLSTGRLTTSQFAGFMVTPIQYLDCDSAGN